MKELDKSGLEFVKMDATKRINKLDAKMALQRDVQTTGKKNKDGRPLLKGRQGGSPNKRHPLDYSDEEDYDEHPY